MLLPNPSAKRLMKRSRLHLYKGLFVFLDMGALEVQPYPLPSLPAYDAGFSLEVADRLGEINARIAYAPGCAHIDWKATDDWRRAGIYELPHPPSGQGYFFNHSTHMVELQAVAEGNYIHIRRPVDAGALENDPRNQVKLEVARKNAAKREMQEAIRQTEALLAKKARKAGKKAL